MKKKIIFFVLAIGLIVIQFISSGKNVSSEIFTNDISKVTEVPEGVLMVLEKSCYDCHSNNTNYPWYNNIQPVSWWLNNHIKEGKHKLNFSEFGNYKTEIAKKKLIAVAKVLDEDEMPLFSYTLIHRETKLEDIQKKLIIVWAKNKAITYTAN